ncbi:FAD-binding protein, partial [Streptomyces sp. G35A]
MIGAGPAGLAASLAAAARGVRVTLVDAAVRESVSLPGERVVVHDPQPGQILTGPETVVTYRGPDFDHATSLALYRVVGGRTATRL